MSKIRKPAGEPVQTTSFAQKLAGNPKMGAGGSELGIENTFRMNPFMPYHVAAAFREIRPDLDLDSLLDENGQRITDENNNDVEAPR